MLNKITSLFELPARVFGPLSRREFFNVEGIEEDNFFLERKQKKHGTSCMLRIKNEERKIESTIRSITHVFDEIVVVDNGSTDNTLGIVNQLANESTNLSVYRYKYNVARCGAEHNSTQEMSLRSLAYYYNWCLSKCSFGYVVKWDADMILSSDSFDSMKKKLNQLSHWRPTFISLEIQTVYFHQGGYYLALNEINCEDRIFPNRSDVYFAKGDNFEYLSGKRYSAGCITRRDCQVFEVKDTGQDEFSHWSTLQFPTQRKKLEYENFCKLRSGDVDPQLFQYIGNCLK